MAELNTLHDLFIDELRDVYDAEKQVLRAQPRLVRATSSEELRTAFETHLEETRDQVARLEQVFQHMEMKARGKHCHGMEGIIEEAKSLLEEGSKGPVLDTGLIAAAQRVEHYEITAYGTLVAWARQMGHTEAASLLQQTLDEEKATDKKLTALAESHLNPAADFAMDETESGKAGGARGGSKSRGR